MKRIRAAAGCALIALIGIGAAPRERPANWAQPVIDTSIENCFRVSGELYRCEQPERAEIPDLKSLGVKSLLNLRSIFSDSKSFEQAGIVLLREPMTAGSIKPEQLVAALRQFRDAPKPVMVHCWHGADRTGAFVAAYRIVFQDWTPAAALDELRNGGFGFHEAQYQNIVRMFESLDATALRRQVMGP